MKVEFTLDELDIIQNSLNEICNGINIPDSEFESRLGASKEEVLSLLEKLDKIV